MTDTRPSYDAAWPWLAAIFLCGWLVYLLAPILTPFLLAGRQCTDAEPGPAGRAACAAVFTAPGFLKHAGPGRHAGFAWCSATLL